MNYSQMEDERLCLRERPSASDPWMQEAAIASQARASAHTRISFAKKWTDGD